MAKKFNRGIINLKEIEDALSMESVLEHYGVKHENNRLECPLPNHFEKTGSFFLYENDKGEERFKCHGCGAKGKAINLAMEMEEVGFHEAVKVAEEITGVEAIYSKAMKHVVQDSNMDKLMKWLYKTYFRKSEYWITTETKSTSFIEYLKSRNIPKDVAYEYGLGFAEGFNNNYDGAYEDGLLDKAVELKVIPRFETIEDARPLIDAGLLYNPKGTDDLVATLRNAVVFPVIVNGKIKGFIGRNIDSAVKYIKTTNFGLWNADYIEDGDDIILVEGCFDALCLNMIGLNAYALLGTHAMTNEVKQVLLRASRIYILFDDEKYKEEKGGTNSGGQGALDIAEELGYKAMICKPLGVKDINEALINLYNTNRSTMDEDEAFNKAKEDLYERVLTVVYGKKVIGEDGEVVNDEDGEPVREGGAKSLVDIKLDKWLEITDEIKRIQGLKNLITTAYIQFNGDSALLEIFSTKLKEYGIKGTYFKEVLGKVKKEVVLEKTKSSANESNALMVSSFGQEWVDWEVVDGVLYKNIPEFKEDGSGFVQEVISITAPKIDFILNNLKTGETEVQLSYVDKFGNYTEMITERKNIAQKYKIVDVLAEKPFDIVDKTGGDIVNYLRWYENTNSASIKQKDLTEVTGYYNDNTYIYKRGEIITADGLMEKNDSKIIYDSMHEDREIKEITEINYDKWKELVRNVFPLLIETNEIINSVGVMGWYLVTPYKEPLNNKGKRKQFPPLNVFGVQGSGKSTLIMMLQELFSGTDDLMLCSIKPYSIIIALSLSNSFVTVLDEYKLENIGETQNATIIRLVNEAYNSNEERRGNGNNPVNRYKLQSPLCVVGEHAFTGESSDSAKDRALIYEFSKSWIDENSSRTDLILNKIKSYNLEDFIGGYLMFVIRTLNDGRFDAMYERATERVDRFVEENSKLTNRNKIALKVNMVGIEAMKELYKEVGLEFTITDEQLEKVMYHSMEHALDDEVSETSLDRAMNYFTTFIFKYLDEDMKTLDSDKKLLYIKQSEFYEQLDRERNTGKANIPNKSGMKTYIKNNMKSKNRYVVDINKPKNINGKTVKCIVFDIKKLEEIAHIDIDTWVGTKEVEQDYYYDGLTSIPHRTEETRDRSVTNEVKKIVIKKLEGKLKIRLENVNTINLEKEIYKRVKNGFKEGNVVIDNLVSELVSDLTKFWKDNEDKIIDKDSETMEAILENFKVG